MQEKNWVVDRFIKDELYNQKQTKNLYFGKIIWLIAPWTFGKIPKVLKDNKVFCTIHHIDEDKLDSQSLKEFHERDKYVDLYHATTVKR